MLAFRDRVAMAMVADKLQLRLAVGIAAEDRAARNECEVDEVCRDHEQAQRGMGSSVTHAGGVSICLIGGVFSGLDPGSATLLPRFVVTRSRPNIEPARQ